MKIQNHYSALLRINVGKFQPIIGYEDPGVVEVQLYSFFNLCARLGSEVGATPRPLFPQKTNPYPFYRWAQRPPPEFEPRPVQAVANPCTD